MKIEIQSRIENPERVEWRREQIVKAATGRFAVDGFHRTTIKGIAESAGVSAGLIYSYVRDKEEVLFLVFESIFRTYQREIPRQLADLTDPLQRFSTAVRAYCECVDNNIGATVVGYRESASLRPELRKAIKKLEIETNKLVSSPIEECIRAGYFRSVDVDLLTSRLVFLAHGWALKHWYFRDIVTLNGYIEEGLDSFLHALLTPSGWYHWRSIIESLLRATAEPLAEPARLRAKTQRAKDGSAGRKPAGSSGRIRH